MQCGAYPGRFTLICGTGHALCKEALMDYCQIMGRGITACQFDLLSLSPLSVAGWG